MNPGDGPNYRSPDFPEAAAPINPRALRAFKLGLASLLLTPTVFVASLAIADTTHSSAFVLAAVAALAACVIVSFVLGYRAVQLGRAARDEVPSFPVAERGRGYATAGVWLGVSGVLLQFVGFAMTCLVLRFIGRGRQLRRRGKALLPRVEPSEAWTTRSFTLEVAPSLRTSAAERWRENARTEHASVASFARLTLDLMALGAPPALIAAAQRDALDEVRHAELCFSIARSMDGRAEGPAAFPEAAERRSLPSVRTLALAEVAVDALVDGAFNEGVSARIAAALVRRCGDPSLAASLREIAADEGRHAAHGWDVVEWCLAEGGGPVASALLGAAEGIERRGRTAHAGDDSLETLGLHGATIETRERERAVEEVTRRARRLVAVTSPPAAARPLSLSGEGAP